MARYKKRYNYDRSLEFVAPLLVLIFLGVMYAVLARMEHGYMGFILLLAASALMIYWARELKKMARQDEQLPASKQSEQKTWVYDLIKSSDEVVFVAEIPGPEEEVTTRLIDGMLHIRGGQNFYKAVQLEVAPDMGVAEFKYRNGVLTLKIRRI